MYLFSFEKLEVWQKSRILTKRVYVLTNTFPESEKFGLIPQIRRAVISVCSNITEESSGVSKEDWIHFCIWLSLKD